MHQRKAHDKCGLFGIYGHADAAELCYLGIFAQQHRGQESAGIATSDGQLVRCHKGMGLVGEVFKPDTVDSLRGQMAIGHVRYSTTGSSLKVNAQPLVAEYSQGQIALAHNGNLINAGLIRRDYEARGHIFQTSSDTEVIFHLLADPRHVVKSDPLGHILNHIHGAFCFMILLKDRVIAVRDAYGIRPLSIGRIGRSTYCVASETCAFDLVGAEYVRDVEPGEIVELDHRGITSRFFTPPESITPAHCIFEQVYFSDPASYVYGQNVHVTRHKFGQQLAREYAIDADVVISVPDSGRDTAIGYSGESGIPYVRGFVRSHYVGRSFLQPSQHLRDLSVKMKLNVIRETVRNQRVVVVDDSIVRGTTTRGKIRSLRQAGAKELHLLIGSPPIRFPCYYGIDFPSKQELVAHNRTVEDIRRYLNVDTLGYLSLEGMLSCMDLPSDHFCTACYNGHYRIPVNEQMSKYALERRQLRMFE